MNTIPTEEELKAKLTPEQYQIMRKKGTEAPFSGAYVHENQDGTYACVACGNPLFYLMQNLTQGQVGRVSMKRSLAA